MITIHLKYSFSNLEKKVKINTKINKFNNEIAYVKSNDIFIEMNDIIKNIKYQILYYDILKDNFIYIGIYPKNISNVEIPVKISSSPYLIIKLRQILNISHSLKVALMNSEIMENNNTNNNTKLNNTSNENEVKIVNNNNNNDNNIKSTKEKKQKRAKERTISEVIKSVFIWRRLYNIYHIGLEKAAHYVGISKKSLDDYLIQIKAGKTLGFDFSKNKNQKIGKLRKFIRDNKK